MRKIKTRSEIEKRAKKNQIVISVLMILILGASTIGFAMIGTNAGGNSKRIVKFGEAEFINSEGFWQMQLGNSRFYFDYLPNETRIDSYEDLPQINSFNGKTLYIISENQNSFQKIATNMNLFVERIQLACFDEKTCKGDLPITDCKEDNTIIVKIGENNTKIYNEDQCIFIETTIKDEKKTIDEFFYRLFGVKN